MFLAAMRILSLASGNELACCIAEYNRGQRCNIVHIHNSTARLSNSTPNPTPRMTYILQYMHATQVLHGIKDDVVAFHTADTLAHCIWSTNGFAHTRPAESTVLLYPTPYMLRDILNGRLSKMLDRHCHSIENFSNFERRQSRLFFRGKNRNSHRRLLATLGQRHPHELDIKLLSNDKIADAPAVATLQKPSPESQKLKYKFLLHAKGGTSQWNIYSDFLMGGLVIKRLTDHFEEWATPLWASDDYTETYTEPLNLPALINALAANSSNCYVRATSAKIVACSRLCIKCIERRFTAALRMHKLRQHT